MLVCNVSLRPPRSAIAADLAEVAEAVDATATGLVVFATLVDDPASVRETVDAYLGEIMVETASADAVADAGFVYVATIQEGMTAADAEDAAITTAPSTPTWDPSTVSNVALSNGNLTATNTSSTVVDQGARVANAFAKTSGKFYFETTLVTIIGGCFNDGIGIGTTASTYVSMISGSAVTGAEMFISGTIYCNGPSTGISLGTRSNGDVIGIAVDMDNLKIWFKKVSGTPGNWNNSGTANPATNVGGITIPAGSMVPFSTYGSAATGNVVTANFGASAFTGTVPSGFTSGWL